MLEGDYVWDHVKDISQLAPVIVERLEHYFGTYKLVPGEPNKMVISGKYGFDHAKAVIEAASQDYQEKFGDALQERRQHAEEMGTFLVSGLRAIGRRCRSFNEVVAFCRKRGMSPFLSFAAA